MRTFIYNFCKILNQKINIPATIFLFRIIKKIDTAIIFTPALPKNNFPLILNKNIYNKLSFKNAYSTTILKSSFSTINNQNIDNIN